MEAPGNGLLLALHFLMVADVGRSAASITPKLKDSILS